VRVYSSSPNIVGGDENKKSEMGRAFSAYGEEERCIVLPLHVQEVSKAADFRNDCIVFHVIIFKSLAYGIVK
jgi:HSP20 family molecular chaperone IbpA